MACTNPVGVHRKNGSAAKRPCGTCLDCRLDYARQWAVRCYHEASMHEENSFVTLTFNDENLPKDHSIRKGDVQNFMKRLRTEIDPKKVRFFGCGEYGRNPKTGTINRPHYHICLFGYDFPDKEIHQTTPRRKGDPDILYISELLGSVWKKGFHTIGEVNYKTAGYVARYVMKKHMGKWQNFVYDGLEPEFALMSRGQKTGGGIGRSWIEKYLSDCYPKDFVTINGKKHKPPKYYDSILEKKNKKLFDYVMAKRELEAFKKIPETDKRLVEKDRYRKQVTRRLERNLDNADYNNVCTL